MPRYSWEPTHGISGRYRDTRTGRFVPTSIVRRELDTYLDNSQDAIRILSHSLRDRQIGLAEWEHSMRRIIKNTHINSVVLERGGYANMRPQDWGRVGSAVRKQYEYLTNFGLQIADGTQRLDGTLMVRMDMYTQAGRTTYYQSAHANMKPEVTMVGSVRHARDSCRECIDLDGKWFRMGDPAYKLPGQRICLTRCHCSERYGAEVDGAIVEMGAA
jgi:hypothetical protein